MKSSISFISIYVRSLISGLLSLAIALIKRVLREAKHLPYTIQGRNPYFFSTQTNDVVSLYAGIQTLFGWMSLTVVAYVFYATQKIVILLNLLNANDTNMIYISSSVFAIIVFYFEKFILSYPKVNLSVKHDVWKYNHPNLSLEHIFYYPIFFIKKIFSIIFQFFLFFLRLSLSLIIAGLVLVAMLFQANDLEIQKYLTEAYENQKSNSFYASPQYKQYSVEVSKLRNIFYKNKVESICLMRAYTGFKDKSDIENISKNIDMSSAPIDLFKQKQIEPPNYPCILEDNRPCKKKDCHEYKLHRDKLDKLQNDYKTLQPRVKQLYDEANIIKSNIKSTRYDDFAGRINAIYDYYNSLYKNDINKFYMNIGMLSPFLLILLIFELLPTVTKLTYPPSAYDRLIADEEKYYQLKSLALLDTDTKKLLNEYSSGFSDELNAINKAKSIQFKHNEEVGKQLINVMTSFRKLIISIVTIILNSKQVNFVIKGIVVLVILVIIVIIVYQLTEAEFPNEDIFPPFQQFKTSNIFS